MRAAPLGNCPSTFPAPAPPVSKVRSICYIWAHDTMGINATGGFYSGVRPHFDNNLAINLNQMSDTIYKIFMIICGLFRLSILK
jgi:hypothetical protein